MPQKPSAEESEIQGIIDNWTNAVRAKDAAALTSAMATNVVMFDLIDPLQYAGATSLKQRAETWLGSFPGPVEYEVRDLRITAGTHVA
jgi:ketosteroid isomerase-like protein